MAKNIFMAYEILGYQSTNNVTINNLLTYIYFNKKINIIFTSLNYFIKFFIKNFLQ